jgi:hypothetical protein
MMLAGISRSRRKGSPGATYTTRKVSVTTAQSTSTMLTRAADDENEHQVEIGKEVGLAGAHLGQGGGALSAGKSGRRPGKFARPSLLPKKT